MGIDTKKFTKKLLPKGRGFIFYGGENMSIPIYKFKSDGKEFKFVSTNTFETELKQVITEDFIKEKKFITLRDNDNYCEIIVSTADNNSTTTEGSQEKIIPDFTDFIYTKEVDREKVDIKHFTDPFNNIFGDTKSSLKNIGEILTFLRQVERRQLMAELKFFQNQGTNEEWKEWQRAIINRDYKTFTRLINNFIFQKNAIELDKRTSRYIDIYSKKKKQTELSNLIQRKKAIEKKRRLSQEEQKLIEKYNARIKELTDDLENLKKKYENIDEKTINFKQQADFSFGNFNETMDLIFSNLLDLQGEIQKEIIFLINKAAEKLDSNMDIDQFFTLIGEQVYEYYSGRLEIKIEKGENIALFIDSQQIVSKIEEIRKQREKMRNFIKKLGIELTDLKEKENREKIKEYVETTKKEDLDNLLQTLKNYEDYYTVDFENLIRLLNDTNDAPIFNLSITRRNPLYKFDEQQSVKRIILDAASKKWDYSTAGGQNLGDDLQIFVLEADDTQTNFGAIKELYQHINTNLLQARNSTNSLDFRAAIRDISDQIHSAKQSTQKTKEIYDDAKQFQGFIFHETDKYYKSLEQGKNTSLTGRTLKILAYVSQMIAALRGSNLKNLNNFDSNIEESLSFLALNSYKDAIASNYKNTLEEVFSIVAGLIMFDDFIFGAKKYFDKEVSSKDIHIYKIQDLYFPSSYFISETIKFFIDKENATNYPHAVISWSGTPDGSSSIFNFNLIKEVIATESLADLKKELGNQEISSQRDLPKQLDNITFFHQGLTRKINRVLKNYYGSNISVGGYEKQKYNSWAQSASAIKIEFFADFYRFVAETFGI